MARSGVPLRGFRWSMGKRTSNRLLRILHTVLLWRFIKCFVDKGKAEDTYAAVEHIGIDETKVYFKRYKWHRLKTRRVCKMQTRSLYAVSQLHLRNGTMQQLPKFILCSVVAF